MAGVAGGIGEYFDVDPTFVRLALIFLALITAIFPLVIAYIIASLIIPKREEVGGNSEPLDFGGGYNQPTK